MKMLKMMISSLFCMVLLMACSQEPEASFATQEQARQQVLDNVGYNSKVYRDANAPTAKIKMRGDSTISERCITGDGWASVDLVDDSGKMVQAIKCNSVSGTIGCMSVTDFKNRPDYAKQDGVCNKNIPFPLPKITE